MIDTAFGTMKNVDLILFLIDGSSKNINSENERILEKLRAINKKTILVINKIDLVKKEKLLELIETYRKEYNFEAIIPISALRNENIENILQVIESHIPYGPAYYNIDEYTDQTTRQIVEEHIREKALKVLNEEVPHGIYVEVGKMSLRKTTKKEDIYDIEGTIYCLKKSHKGIIIGKNRGYA
jgi:GTP-binding protein Era